MREYKFRGKRKDNGEWVYGYYFIEERDIEDGIIWRDIPQIQQRYGDHFQYFDVDPDTVGQYTGLRDNNGKEIYEGDILSIECYSYIEPEDNAFGEVTITVFGNALIVTRDSGETECLYLSDLRGSYTTIYEVIGDIYENPELRAKCTRVIIAEPADVEALEETIKAKIDQITREIFIFENKDAYPTHEAAEKALGVGE